MSSIRVRPLRLRAASTRWAFSLIELLVALAILGILVALLLPAVIQAREAARRMQCRSNLKQLGIAVHQYLETHGVFPAAALGGGNSSFSFNFTGYAALMPFLDAQAAYDRINFEVSRSCAFGCNHGWSRVENQEAFDTPLPIFVCPSNRRGAEVAFLFGPDADGVRWRSSHGAITDYLFNGGGFFWPNARRNESIGSRHLLGPSPLQGNTRAAQVEDGLGMTFLAGESWGGDGANQRWARGWGGSRVCERLDNGYTNPAGTLYRPAHYENFLHAAYTNTHIQTDGSAVVGGIVAVTVDFQGNPYPPNDCAYPTYSGSAARNFPNFHAGHGPTVQFVMADGSVQSLVDSIDLDVYVALSTIAGGETNHEF
ncbi:hypothetical protein Pan216_42110 [Planctomycetes bacterium Pan216]|uniref:DUF1559 domain-containing protein n=1 Tax=Kolteria novifilia TaxID=2527975 RepID=A0A518B8Q0_9BACT|nr:hypothetical protein Pan216_42110 [Planctomycetes bacterium Pan216]